MNDILSRLVEKTKNKFIFEAFEACDICTVSFDLSMSRGVDTFILIVHFLNCNWELGHQLACLKLQKPLGATMATQVNEMLTTYGLNVKILAYVKNESNDLNTMISALTFAVSCKLLGLRTSFIGSCWGHAMFKCW
jgi:hypothetical protein